jgi:hypothetical protein
MGITRVCISAIVDMFIYRAKLCTPRNWGL